MTISLGKRVKLFCLFIFVYVLWAIDIIGNFPLKVVALFARVGMYGFLFFVVLTSFFVEVKNPPEYFYSATPPATDEFVLGAAEEKEVEIPQLVNEIPFPDITSKSVYVYDLNYEKELFALNAHVDYPPASTTKLMTALVALDIYDLDEEIKIPYMCTEIESSKGGYYWNEQVNVLELLTSLLVMSSGDSACALATGKVEYGDFMAKMNDFAQELGMSDTFFANPVGLDGEFGEHISTAHDLYLLGRAAIEDDLLADIVQTKEIVFTNELEEDRLFINTNDLLWVIDGAVGVKTGRTEGAKEVLIFAYEKDGVSLIIVVMGSEDRFLDTEKILNWILNSYSWSVF